MSVNIMTTAPLPLQFYALVPATKLHDTTSQNGNILTILKNVIMQTVNSRSPAKRVNCLYSLWDLKAASHS